MTAADVPGPDLDERLPSFDAALATHATALELADGRRIPLPVHRWHAPAAGADMWLLDRCTGPTVDLGCGPGRLLAELLARGVPALGVDHSHQALALCRARGVPVVRRDVFARLPGEGRWRHALLADGNIGIGGNPQALLRRAATLVSPGGSVLVETTPDDSETWSGSARLCGVPGPWFAWSTVDVDTLVGLAPSVGLTVGDVLRRPDRGFVELIRGPGHE